MRTGQPSRPFSITTVARLDIVAFYFRGLPRLGNTKPRASAVDRSWPANLSASLRSDQGASGGQATRRLLQGCPKQACQISICVSLFIALQISGCLDL